MRLLDDNPTTEDRLGFGKTADVLYEVICEASDAAILPLTIGVFGGWGAGKSSLMKMVEQRLNDASVKTVWFNAWKYDGKEVIWNALLQSIFYKMKVDAEADKRGEFHDRVVRTAKSLAVYAAKVGTRFIPGGVVRESDVDAVVTMLGTSADDESFAFINGFEATFAQLTKDYLKDRGYLVIFIDDLDRCLPENAIQVLEALKLYLDCGQCVFVVGAEPAVIEEAITRRYASNPVLSSSEYLEKIVQVQFVVPRVRTRRVLQLYEENLLPQDSRQLEDLVIYSTRRNPRKVKRFLNAYTVATRSVNGDGPLELEEQLSLSKVLLTQHCFPQFYRHLVTNPGLFKELSGAEASAWENAGLKVEYKNFSLRRFLEKTRETCPRAKEVRRWIRVTDVDSPHDDDRGDDELASAEVARREGGLY